MKGIFVLPGVTDFYFTTEIYIMITSSVYTEIPENIPIAQLFILPYWVLATGNARHGPKGFGSINPKDEAFWAMPI